MSSHPGALEYTRTFSFFEPTYTYRVTDPMGGTLGAVARNDHEPRVWWASNMTWSGGGDLVQTFRTRWEAADALRHIADGTATPETYGGYAPRRDA